MALGPSVPEQVGEVVHAGPARTLPAEVVTELVRKPPLGAHKTWWEAC